mmetsp:Transcript_11786/g.10425  ORF Transcript_11786/g.10425 Transcript_11786/m.10425 type:complete len:138 (+) Transcript_11786:346-759(+)
MKNHFNEPNFVSDTDMASLISVLQDSKEYTSRQFIYFSGNKTAIAEEDLPTNFIKFQVYHNEPVSYDSFFFQISKDKEDMYIKPHIVVFYSPSGFKTFYTHYSTHFEQNIFEEFILSIKTIAIGKTTEKAIIDKLGN